MKQTALLPLGGGPATWAARINAHLGRAVEAIVATGSELVAAKAALKHGDWERLFADHPKAVANPVRFSKRTAEMLMAIAKHPILAKANHGALLPPSWRTLYELTRLPPPVLEQALTDGRIHADLERAEVRRLATAAGPPAPSSNGGPAPPSTPEGALSALDRDVERHMEAWTWRPETFLGELAALRERAQLFFRRTYGRDGRTK